MIETLEVGGLSFEVRRSERRQTLGLTVDRGGELVASIPANTPRAELARWLGNKLLWVHRKLALKKELLPKVRSPEFVSGESFCYLGRRYRLARVRAQGAPLHFDGARFTLRRDVAAAESQFRRWYIETGGDWVERRLTLLCPRTGVTPRRVEVRDLGFRWGSCTRGGTIYFNWRVLQLPVRSIDYVIMHELVHLVVPSHGQEFWAVLERALPDWRERQQKLAASAKDYLVFGLPVISDSAAFFAEDADSALLQTRLSEVFQTPYSAGLWQPGRLVHFSR